ncbi:hypothetical protein [Paraflavitalea speifideaquila]|uniref:hypothetical protein n=1 Tax=Paraflavitalea speifideaquila TaxID=3076558 RepID=UPI0028F06159|nr:hypothetical protein [Paraflavitalea speifideiaquila]
MDQESGKWTPQQRQVVRIVKNQFLQNLLKIHWVEETQEFTEEVEAGLPRKDVYLVKICCGTFHKILITTDVTLHQNVSDLYEHLQITPHFAERFIEEYLKQ